MNRCFPLLALTVILSAGCGAEAESASDSEGPAFGQALNPWDTIPADSLYGATPVENVRVTPVVLDVLGLPSGWEGTRIAAISDLQLDLWSGNPEVAAAAIRAAVASRPDVVVLLGDYLGDGTDVGRLRQLLLPLRDLPVYAVLGDRDVRSDSLAARIAGALSAGGVRVLRNQIAVLQRGGDTASIAGIDAELAGEPVAEQQWVLSQLGLGTPIGFLISHNPVLAARADNDRVPAAIAGGVFCGSVEIPGTPRLSWLNSEAIPAAVVDGAERLYRIGPMVMFVTCGTGYGFVPVRFGERPEVALITLRRVGATTEEDGEAGDTLGTDSLLQQYEASLEDTTEN